MNTNASHDSVYQSFYTTMKRIGLPLTSCKGGAHSIEYLEYFFTFSIEKPQLLYSSLEKYLISCTSSIGGVEIKSVNILNSSKGEVCVWMTRNHYQTISSLNDSYLNKNVPKDTDLKKLSGIEFEDYLYNILTGFNYNVEKTKASGDQGVDLLVYYMGHRIAIQCKRYNSSIGNQAVQEVFAGSRFHKADASIVVSNSLFTKAAIELAESCGVLLVGRDEIDSFLKNPHSYFWSAVHRS